MKIHNRKSKIGTIIGSILLILILVASISVLGFATKGFKQKPSWDNLKKPEIGKEKPKEEKKTENDEDFYKQKELQKVKSIAMLNSLIMDTREGKSKSLQFNKKYIRSMKELAESAEGGEEYKNSEAYKAMETLTGGFDEKFIDKVKLKEDEEVTFGFLLNKNKYSGDKYKELIDNLEKEDVMHEDDEWRIQGKKTEEEGSVLMMVTCKPKVVKELNNDYLKVLSKVIHEIYQSIESVQENELVTSKEWLINWGIKNSELYEETEDGYKRVEKIDPVGNGKKILDAELLFINASLECGYRTLKDIDMFLSVVK